MGRKSWQFASRLPAEKLSRIHNPGIQPDLLVAHAYNPIHRRHQYDPAGELIRTLDKLRGEIKYEYEANGQLHSRDTGKLVDSEEFRYDAAANRLNFNTSQFDHVKDNRLKRWRDQEYANDAWGNLIEKRSGMGKLQTFVYDCENRLVKAETLVNGKLESSGFYRYDSLGRRVGKQSVVNGVIEQKHFLWQGLRMLREESPGQSSLYLYEPGSYAPDPIGWIDPLGLCSKALSSNMTKGGTPRPANSAAHHIVGDTAKLAAPARAVLAKHDIHVDDAVNGVFLPNLNNVDSRVPGILHNGKHPSSYFENVNQLIISADKAGGKPMVLKTIDRIRKTLLSSPRDAQWSGLFG